MSDATPAPRCPTCDAEPTNVETATVHLDEPRRTELVLRCDCGLRTEKVAALPVEQAIERCRAAIRQRAWFGSSHAALGMLLEIAGRADEAYEEHAVALRCNDRFDRAFCLERRGAYEARHGWLRNALHSLRRALTEDRRASGAREAAYHEAISAVERELTAHGIWFPRGDRDVTNRRWRRELELELPPGFGARNEAGQPLTDDVIEIERLVRAERWHDAVGALRALEPGKLVDAIGYASRGAELARAAGRRDAALALQELVVQAYVIWASWSTSGAEGLSRTAEVDRERARLHEWERA